jgi:hypothetical protein
MTATFARTEQQLARERDAARAEVDRLQREVRTPTVAAVHRTARTPAATSTFGEPPTNGATNGSARRAPPSARKAAAASREPFSLGEVEPPPRSRAREVRPEPDFFDTSFEHEVSAAARPASCRRLSERENRRARLSRLNF